MKLFQVFDGLRHRQNHWDCSCIVYIANEKKK